MKKDNDRLNNFELCESIDIMNVSVARVDYCQQHLENRIVIRVQGGSCINIPEKWFKAICDWYYEYHVNDKQPPVGVLKGKR